MHHLSVGVALEHCHCTALEITDTRLNPSFSPPPRPQTTGARPRRRKKSIRLFAAQIMEDESGKQDAGPSDFVSAQLLKPQRTGANMTAGRERK